MTDHLSSLPPGRKALLTTGSSIWSTAAIPEADVPSIKMSDGPMGIASGRVDERDVALVTPCGTALGASWDVDLVQRVGALVGGEAVRLGVDLVLAPNVNLPRSPLAGRAFELFSEDPFLTGSLGVAWISGLQSMGTGSVVKHLVCNDSETQRNTMNAAIDQRSLHEVYLLPFEMAAEADCAGILAAYNRLNGAYCAEHHDLLTTIVRHDWGYTGPTISDWFGTQSTLGSIKGGLDLEMPGPGRFLGTKFSDAVAAGEADEVALDRAAARVAAAAKRFSGEKQPPVSDAEADQILIEAAAAGFTLLRNEGDILPLVLGRDKTIAVIGPNAAAPCFQGGTFAKIAVKPDALRPVEAIERRFGAHCTVVFEPGVDPQPRLPEMPVTPSRDIGDGCSDGMTVDYFGAPDFVGEPLASETRVTNSLTWFVGMHELGAWDRPAGIKASGSFLPKRSGRHLFYVGGTGSVTLIVGGKTVFSRYTEIAASDIMGKLKSGDADCVEVELDAGHAVYVVVEFRYAPARAHGLWYGIREPDDADSMLARAVAAARSADAVVLIVGETADSGVESKDRGTTKLHERHLALIDAVTAVNPRTIIVANVGHAFDTAWETKAAALLLTWYPGQEFARALAAVLAGDREPGGRMPVTIAQRDEDYPVFDLTPDKDGNLLYSEGTKIGYRSFAAQSIAPRHALGSGFGYADFDIISADADVSEAGVDVFVTIRNVSARDGAEIIQIYREAPELTLVGFAKVQLAAGAETRVKIPLARRRFMAWQDGWALPSNHAEIFVGRSSVDAAIRLSVDLS